MWPTRPRLVKTSCCVYDIAEAGCVADTAMVGKGKSARMSCKGKQPAKGKPSAKHTKQVPITELVTSAVLSKVSNRSSLLSW